MSIYFGHVAVKISRSCNIQTQQGTVQGIGWHYCQMPQDTDGYGYSTAFSELRNSEICKTE